MVSSQRNTAFKKAPTKTLLITGGNTGLGFETAKSVAAHSTDLQIVLTSRSLERGKKAAYRITKETTNVNVSAMELDLGSFDSIKNFVKQLNHSDFPPLHTLVCNAGVQFVQETKVTNDGLEATFGVNHLGHFLLVRLLIELLKENGRILIVSSDTHDPFMKTGMPIPLYTKPQILADPTASDHFLSDYSTLSRGQIRYTTSKLCNLYFTYELARKLQKSKASISVAAFNPGMMPGKNSLLARDYPLHLRFMWLYVVPLFRFFRSSIRSTKQSGKDLAQIILSSSIESGTYWDGSKIIRSSKESYNRKRAVELWNWSSERLNLSDEL